MPRILLFCLDAPKSSDLATRLHAIGVEDVTAASSYVQACAMVDDEAFDLAIIHLESETELEAVSAAVNLQRTVGLGIVYWVGASEHVSLRRARRSAPAGYLFEPFSDQALAVTLEMALQALPPRRGSAKRLRLGAQPATVTPSNPISSGEVLSAPQAAPLPNPNHESSETARLRALLENTSDLISVLDPLGAITYEGPSVARLLGYDTSQRIGMSGFAFVHAEDRDRVRAAFERALGLEATGSAEYRIRHQDGSWRTFESVWRNYLTNPAVGGIVCSSRDVTERKELQSQLTHADRLASVGMLAAAVGHEINNPLTYIIGNLESITAGLECIASSLAAPSERDPPSRREGDSEPRTGTSIVGVVVDLAQQAEQAAQGAQRIAAIVNELRTFVRTDAGPERSVHIADVLDDAVAIAENQIRHHRCRVVREYAVTPSLLASRNRLVQVFLNLLTNAIQAMPEDGKANEIHLSTWMDGDLVCASVRDTGCGIAPESLPRLFDPFFTTKPAGVGTGLGLPISRGIVQAYCGTIEVESELDRGSRFVVRLPIRTSRAPDRSAPRGPQVTASVTMAVRVLVVDDDPLVGSLMKRMLTKDHHVVVAQSVSAAKKLLSEYTFDVIVCDLMMPEASGMSLYDYLVGAFPALARKMIFATGGAFTESARRFFERVHNVRLDKPFDGKQLRYAVAEAYARGTENSSNPPSAPIQGTS